MSDSLSIASDFSVIPDSMFHMDDMEQPPAPMCASFFQSSPLGVSGASGQYEKVTFGSINKIGYEPNISLSVIFWFSDQFKPQSSDRIALYRIGFSSTKDFLCYKWVPAPSVSAANSETHRSFTVDFEADMLPDDPDSFYQICYLMKNGNILGVSTTFTLKQTETLTTTNEVEEAARNVMSVRIRELVKQNNEITEEMSLEKSLTERLKLVYNNLLEDHQECISEKENNKKLIQNLKETLYESEAQIEKLKMEILSKEEEMKRQILLTQEVEERLTDTVLAMNEIKGRLSETIDEKSISEERHQVLIEDNQDLKENLRLVKEELETSMKEKVASEMIASNLSQELQTTRDQVNDSTSENSKLVKKIKKLRGVIALMEAANNDDFICVEGDSEERREEQEEKVEYGMITASMSASRASQVSGMLSQCASSTCSQKLNETVVSVKKTMDEIKHQLNEQTEEMKSLKREISRKALKTAEIEANVDAEFETQAEALPVREEIITVESEKEEVHSSDDKVLYQHCFLPAPCTAPVFLPSRKASPVKDTHSTKPTPTPTPRSTAPSAPSPTPSMMESGSVELPHPLCPIKTETARTAAVLRQFSESANNQQETVTQQPRQHTPVERSAVRPAHQQESDEEDYHSTSDAGEQQEAAQTLNSFNSPLSYKCPMCPLEFLPSGIHLLNEHINNHLDRTCPVCSLAFQRSTSQKTYEEHVQSHFEEENIVSEDPSGPWDPRDTDRSFQLLEID